MAGTLKRSVVVAVCAVLLHSSMGQQPAPAPVAVPAPPPPPYCSNCTSICFQSCQASYKAEAQQCSGMLGATLGNCIKGCSRNRCNGDSYAAVRDTCGNSTCTPSCCGPPCVVDCCKSCKNDIGAAYGQCMFWADRMMNYCPPNCINNCYSNCVNSTAAAPSPTAY